MTSRALTLLLMMGFEDARLFDRGWDALHEEQVAVLACVVPGEDDSGYIVPFKESLAARAGAAPVVSSSSAVSNQWVSALGVADRAWVEIPVMSGAEVIGIVVASWTGTPEQLDTTDLATLRLLGAALGSYLNTREPVATDALWTVWDATEGEALDTRVVQVARFLADTLDAAMTSVFAFSWSTQTLTMIAQDVAPGLPSPGAPLPEVYAVGEYLTGRAWRSRDLHHILTPEFSWSVDALVTPEAMARHNDVVGQVRSVMFVDLGGTERRYLLRFVNRASSPAPFIREFGMLQRLARDLRLQVDAAVAAQRLDSLQAITSTVASGGSTSEVIARVASDLAQMRVWDFVVATHDRDASGWSFVQTCGPRLDHAIVDTTASWREDPLYVRAVQGGTQVLPVPDGATGAREGQISAILRRAGYPAALSIPLNTGQTRGCLFVPVDEVGAPEDGVNEVLPGVGAGTASLLVVYAALIGNALETALARARAEGARRALGFLGHELRGPLARLGSAAESGLVAAIRQARATTEDAEALRAIEHALFERRRVVHSHQREVNAALELAPIVAQEATGTLALEFRRCRLGELVEHVVRQLEEQTREAGTYHPPILVEASCEGVGDVVCDWDYLAVALRNVLVNAQQYSRAEKGAEPRAIRVRTELTKSSVGIEVSSYGQQVAESERDVIFAPWVRGAAADERGSVSGMGLGLFIARRLLQAHGGDVVLKPRVAQADVAGPLATVFRLELPIGIEPGPHHHRWPRTSADALPTGS